METLNTIVELSHEFGVAKYVKAGGANTGQRKKESMKQEPIILSILLLALALAASPAFAEADTRPSVLFINVDDWNDWNEVLRGHPQAITPHIDRLADRGLAFTNAICSSPMCSPSRPALFSGVHPARSGNITNRNGINPWRTYVPDAVTLPKHLSNRGWKSIGIAKNFHKGDSPEFDEYIPISSRTKEVRGSGSKWKGPRRWAFAAVPTSEMPDYIAVSKGIEALTSNRDNLFLSLGIYRPHVPWVVPKEYFDQFPLEDIQLPEHRADDLDDLPERLKLLAHNEATFGKDFNKMLVASGDNKGFVRAYLACVTFADEQLGRLLDAWDASSHAANGYIVMWSDHGYMLGEKEGWSKMKPWYDSAHCNLIIAGPGIPKGAVCNKAVSLQDLYPTLIDLLKLPPPPQKIDGNSLVPLLNNPEADWDKPVVMSSEADGIRYDTVLGNDYRMTRLITGETELYKLADDPHEFNNLARNPKYAPVIERLAKHLTFNYPEIPQDGWIEAEAIPRQTSADYGLRGNCHFPQALQGASGGRVICADLHAGKGSYIDFVLDVKNTGTYALGATLLAGGACTVSVADVVDDAAQADTGYPMENIGTVQGGTGAFRDVSFGTVTFDQPGLKLVRFMSSVPKQRLQVDRIQFQQKEDWHKGDQPMKKSIVKTVGMAVLLGVGAVGVATAESASENNEKGKYLSPETEMAIMRVMNLENRIQTLQTVPAFASPGVALANDFSGTWICFTTMRLNGQLGRGIMQINIKQDGDRIVGDGGQLKHPFDPPSTIRPIGNWANLTPFIGQNKGRNMVVIERQSIGGGTWATFTAVMAGDGRTARGTLVNFIGNYGLMLMVRRECLSDFKHLLTEEGRQAEAARRLIGVEKLEAVLDTETMDKARIEWWNTDKNRDGKLQYAEFSHPDWKRANRNDDDVVDWAEEMSDRVLRKLAEEGGFLAKHGNDSQKEWPSIYAWGVAHSGFEELFHFIDWDRDGKITAPEYAAFEDQLKAYNDPSFPLKNEKGQTRADLLVKKQPAKARNKSAAGAPKTAADAQRPKGIEQLEAAFGKEKLAKSREMWSALDKNRDNIWQHSEFPHPDWERANRDGDDGLSWKEELADKMFRSQSSKYPKAYDSSSQEEWGSQEAWNKDRPDFKFLFAFIDWDYDGKISEAEYKVFIVQIKSYTDGSYPKTNERGESGMAVYKRLAAQPPKSQPKKAGKSMKTSWNSGEEWNRDKPTVAWIFPFIDKNSDGKIDSDEYQAIQEYKKKHSDWQARARKELGLTALEEQ